MKTYVVTPYKNRLNETVLMVGYNICFKGVLWKIIPKLYLSPLLIWNTDYLESIIKSIAYLGLFIYIAEVASSHFCLIYMVYTLKCLNIGTPKINNLPFVSNEKIMFYMCPHIFKHIYELM